VPARRQPSPRRPDVTAGGVRPGQWRAGPVHARHAKLPSRSPAFGADDAALRHGIRLIVIDRPGIADPDFHPGRRVLDWPTDVAAVTDRLGLERVAVLGYSGGVPYAAAAAYAMPERISTLALVACVTHIVAGLGLMLKWMCREHPTTAG